MAGRSTGLNKHIVLITPGFAKDEEDSTCIPLLQLYAENLKNKVEKVSIIALQYPFTKEPYKWNGIDVYPIGGANKKWKRFFLYSELVKVFQQIHAHTPVDILHSFWLNETTILAQRLATRFDLPLMASSQGQDVKPENQYLRRIKKANIPVITLGGFQEEILAKSGIEAFDVISPEVRSIQAAEKTFDVVGVGNLIELKNFGYLLDLLGILKKTNVACNARIIGDGPKRAELEKLADDLNLSDSVQFTGELSHRDTLKHIGEAKVLVHPSHFEGFGLVIYEALTSGTYVLAQPVGAAYQNDEVIHLTLEPELDAEMLKGLLKMEPKEVSIDASMDFIGYYLDAYERLIAL